MGLYLVYLINGAITLVAAAAVFAYWVANRKRIAAETVGRAEEQALRVMKDAERDAESRKKEALLEAKEKAHEMRTEAERVAREKHQQLVRHRTAAAPQGIGAQRQDVSRRAQGKGPAGADRRRSPNARRPRPPLRRNTSSSSPLSSTSSSGCRA